jgi:hypothetical protein
MTCKIDFESGTVEMMAAGVSRDMCEHVRNHFSNNECGRYDVSKVMISGNRRIDVRFTVYVSKWRDYVGLDNEGDEK